MKKVLYSVAGLFLSTALVSTAYGGGIDNKTNWSAEYIRTLNRNAATDFADIAAYNPAGTVKLQDRYGPLPGETQNLFAIMALKIKMQDLLITRLEQGKGVLVFSFHEKTPVKPEKILAIIAKAGNNIRFTPDARLMAPIPAGGEHSPGAVLHAAHEIISHLKSDGI